MRDIKSLFKEKKKVSPHDIKSHQGYYGHDNYDENFLVVNLLRAQKLGCMHQLPSFFNTMTTSDE